MIAASSERSPGSVSPAVRRLLQVRVVVTFRAGILLYEGVARGGRSARVQSLTSPAAGEAIDEPSIETGAVRRIAPQPGVR